MHCGHGGYCRTCAYKLLAVPRGLCPVCRAALSAVCKIPQDTPIGDARVVSPYACTPAAANQATVASEPATAPHSDSRGDGAPGENVPEATNSIVLEHSEVHDDDVDLQHAASPRSASPSQRSIQMTDVATGGGNDAAAPVATSAVDANACVHACVCAVATGTVQCKRHPHTAWGFWSAPTAAHVTQLPPSPHARTLKMIEGPPPPPAALPPAPLASAAAAAAPAAAAAAAEHDPSRAAELAQSSPTNGAATSSSATPSDELPEIVSAAQIPPPAGECSSAEVAGSSALCRCSASSSNAPPHVLRATEAPEGRAWPCNATEGFEAT